MICHYFPFKFNNLIHSKTKFNYHNNHKKINLKIINIKISKNGFVRTKKSPKYNNRFR